MSGGRGVGCRGAARRVGALPSCLPPAAAGGASPGPPGTPGHGRAWRSLTAGLHPLLRLSHFPQSTLESPAAYLPGTGSLAHLTWTQINEPPAASCQVLSCMVAGCIYRWCVLVVARPSAPQSLLSTLMCVVVILWCCARAVSPPSFSK